MRSAAVLHAALFPTKHWKAVLQIAEVAVVMAIFAIHAGWRVPAVNEPHYLGKAKHYWNPRWIEGDFFLDSADAHRTFYLVVGWLSLGFGLEGMAHIGRLAMWGLQAWGWTRLSRAVMGHIGWAAWTAALFTMTCSYCQMAGEWVIGGLEAKGIAYALIFFALEGIVRNRWHCVWPLLGIATAFHALVGGWMFIIAGMAWLTASRPSPISQRRWVTIASVVGGLILGAVGVVPALQLTRNNPDEIIRQANTIYVYYRLRHHLVPQAFPPVLVARFLLLAFAWGLVAWRFRHLSAVCRISAVVIAALALALLGTSISWTVPYAPEWAASWLRYYWFRMADALLPLGTAFTAVLATRYARAAYPRWGYGLTVMLMLLAGGHVAERIAWQVNTPWPPADSPDKVSDYLAWRDACRWIDQNTPRDALFLTPRLAHTFKWWANRPEVVNWKDIPQDAPAIVEWWRRIGDVHFMPAGSSTRYYESLASQPRTRLKHLADRYGATHCITRRTPPLDFPLLYQNRSYSVYQIK